VIQGLLVLGVNGKQTSIFGTTASVRLSITIDETEAATITIDPEDPFFIASGYMGLIGGSAADVDMDDVALFGPLQITAGDYSFFDDFARADADDLGAGYNADQIGEADAPFHIKGGFFQNWVDADGTFIIAMATPSDQPAGLTNQQLVIALNAFGAGGGPVFPAQAIECFGRSTQTTIAGARFYYVYIAADQIDPTNGYVSIYHLYCPDSDPNNAVYDLLVDAASVNIPEGSVITFDVQDV
jgi:hypothetical protein